ncbi:hypothetical protein [Algicola sagamiensis]|uniref:hypothetical protein n=1 Tax=Algicola sagamiensis TaxID=163869 RepID=UPI000376678F|nr:hypothetical protein [Algicola sagamiensis]
MQILNTPQTTLNPHTTALQNSASVEKSSAVAKVSDPSSASAKPAVQDVVFIGRGSSIAYALTEVCDRYEGQHSKAELANEKPLAGRAVVIGSSEPWSKEVRGSGFINHQNELIDSWGDKAPKFNKEYADRQQFSDANTAQISRAAALGVQEVNNEVKSVKKGDDGLFKITTKQGQEFVAKQVVMGIGAGPHIDVRSDRVEGEATPAEMRLNNITLNDKEALKGKVLDLDEFMRMTDNMDSLAGKRVVVHGPNAGIDAVERAGDLGADIQWMIRSTAPVLLDGNQLEHAPRAAAESLVKVDKVTINPTEDGKMSLDYTGIKGRDGVKSPDGKIEADYYVFALGQDSKKQGAIESVLDKSIQQDFEPIYDTDQIYSDKPYETVLGIRSKSSSPDQGVVVIGASVAQLSGSVQHNYLAQVEERIDALTERLSLPKVDVSKLKGGSSELLQTLDNSVSAKTANLSAEDKAVFQRNVSVLKQELAHYQEAQAFLTDKDKVGRGVSKQVENVVKTEVASVVVSPQLATVKASVGALTNIMPRYIAEGETNYLSDNRTMLRVSLANDFPNISEEAADTFIKETLELRVMTKSDFNERVLTDLQKHTQHLLSKGSDAEAIASLTGLNVKPDLAQRLVDAAQGREDTGLKAATEQALEGTIPAWGTPDHVRYGYATKLSDLNQGIENQVPLSLFWLDEPISAMNAIRV